MAAVAITRPWQNAHAGEPKTQAAAATSPPVRCPGPGDLVVSGRSADAPLDAPVPFGLPLRLTVPAGFELVKATVTDAAFGPVGGGPDVDGRSWATVTSTLPASTYQVDVATAHPGAPRICHVIAAIKTASPPAELQVALSPGDHAVVGVGQPVIARFDRPVPLAARAEVEQRMSVSTTPATLGRWHWFSATEAHWRPPTFWNPGTVVDVASNLRGLDLGGGLWGIRSRTVKFAIGDAHVSTADVQSHTMTVRSNGQVVRVLPISAGRDAYPTRGGVHLALEKAKEVTMDSSTVGIPRNSPGGYFEKVAWDVRISYGGAFVHAAPWSVSDQGRRNVSHGCINLSPADAEWFYGFTRRGDVVDVAAAASPPDVGDPGMFDWNIPWEQWSAPSAAPVSTKRAPVTRVVS